MRIEIIKALFIQKLAKKSLSLLITLCLTLLSFSTCKSDHQEYQGWDRYELIGTPRNIKIISKSSHPCVGPKTQHVSFFEDGRINKEIMISTSKPDSIKTILDTIKSEYFYNNNLQISHVKEEIWNGMKKEIQYEYPKQNKIVKRSTLNYLSIHSNYTTEEIWLNQRLIKELEFGSDNDRLTLYEFIYDEEKNLIKKIMKRTNESNPLNYPDITWNYEYFEFDTHKNWIHRQYYYLEVNESMTGFDTLVTDQKRIITY